MRTAAVALLIAALSVGSAAAQTEALDRVGEDFLRRPRLEIRLRG